MVNLRVIYYRNESGASPFQNWYERLDSLAAKKVETSSKEATILAREAAHPTAPMAQRRIAGVRLHQLLAFAPKIGAVERVQPAQRPATAPT